MEKDWVRIYETPEEHIAELARAHLVNNGIEAVVMNKKDRTYQLGYVEIYVLRDNVIRGKKILEELEG